MASKVSGVIEKIDISGTSHAIASTAYGYCETAAGTQIKDVQMTGFVLQEGVTVHIKFQYANSASSPKLRINSTEANDAKPIVQYGTTAAGTTSETNGWYAGAVVSFTYDGTSWVRNQGFNTNTTYSYMRPYENTGKGSYSSQGLNPAKTATASWRYQLTAGKYFMYTHYYDNTAQSALTLNIGSTGAKPIYINGIASSSTNYTLPGGQYLVYYDGTNYHFRTDNKMPGNIAGDAATVNGLTVQTAVPANAVFTDTKSFTITANATDGLWDLTGTNGTNAVTYALAPYSSKGTTATFYTAAKDPTLTTRLNYDGYLYATKLYSGGNEVLTSHRTYTAVSGKKPIDNQTPSFGSTFDIEQVGQDATGQVSVTERTVKIPDTAASTSTVGLVNTSTQSFAGIKTFYDHYTNGHIASTTTTAGQYAVIRCTNKGSWMTSFHVRMYTSYESYTLEISGYNYNTQNWYDPKAIMVASTSTSKVTVTFGYDNDATNNYKTLWVAIPIGNYPGIDVQSVVTGHTDTQPRFSVTIESSVPSTVQKTVDVYRPWYRNETVTNATTATSISTTGGTTGKFWRGDNNWSNTLVGPLYVNDTTDAAGTGDTGALIIGVKAGENIAIDGNEVMARNNKATSTLYLNNDGGLVQIGSGGLTSNGNIKAGTTTSGALGIGQTDGLGLGLSLYNGPQVKGALSYGIMLAKTATFGTCGSVTSDWATYFTMNRADTRGWIFKSNGGAANTNNNVASIAGNGDFYTAGSITMGAPIYFSTGITNNNTSRGILEYNSSNPNYGIWYYNETVDKMTFSASGNANSQTSADFGINVHGDGTLTNRNNRIPHTGNTTGTVGGTTIPVYVEEGVIKAGDALGGAAYKAADYYAIASHGTHVSYGTSTAKIGTASAGSATTVSRSDHVHAIDLATGDSNGQVKIAGQNISVAGLGTAAYEDKTAFVYFSKISSGISNNSDAAGTKAYWANNTYIPQNSIKAVYNTAGTEYTLIFSNNNNNYGTVLKWGYADKYLRILRYHHTAGTETDKWYSEDWEKISAGYADSAGSASSAASISKTGGSTAKFWRGDNNWATTLTGSFTVSTAAGTNDLGIYVENTSKPKKIALLIGGTSGNGGIWDVTKGKWVVYSDTNGNVVLNGNANTAAKFNSTRKIELTGAVQGSATTDGTSGWTISTSVNHDHNAFYLTAVGYDTTNRKIYYTKNGSNTDVVNLGINNGIITIDSTTITPITNIADLTGSTITAANLRTNLGLAAALRFIGKATTDISESTTTAPTISGMSSYTPIVGDVVLDNDDEYEYVCIAKSGTTYTWEKLGSSSSYALSGHTHELSIATDSGTTNFVSLSANTTYKLTAGGSTLLFKTPADSDTKLQIAAVTSGTTYYPIVATNSTSAATRQYDATGFAYLGTNGTTSVVGVAKITLGNATSSGSANNKQGSIGLYGSTAYLTTIISGAPTAANTVTLPTGSGTLALVGDNSHSHGNINSSGCVTTAISMTENDYLIIGDNSDNGKIGKGPIFSNTISSQDTSTKFLREDGNWAAPSYYTHPTGDGYEHVPANGTGNNGKFLKAGSTAGSLSWDTAVTSITIKTTSPVSGGSNTATTTTGTYTISLADAYGDTKNPYGVKAKNLVLAGPSTGNNAAPTFRTLEVDDIPDLKKYYVSVFNTSDVTNSTSTTFTQMAAAGNVVGMINAATDNPEGNAKWVHAISLCWKQGTTSSWISQIALGVASKKGMWYRTTSGNIAGQAWYKILDSDNTSAASSNTVSVTCGTDATLATINGTAVKINITMPSHSDVGAASSGHEHGNITNGGCITTTITKAKDDYLIIGDNSASGKIGKGPVFCDTISSQTTSSRFLREDGSWATPSYYTHPTNAGYKHIPSGGSSGQFLGYDSAGTAKWVSLYAATSAGTTGQVLKSTGTGAPEWEDEYSIEIIRL